MWLRPPSKPTLPTSGNGTEGQAPPPGLTPGGWRSPASTTLLVSSPGGEAAAGAAWDLGQLLASLLGLLKPHTPLDGRAHGHSAVQMWESASRASRMHRGYWLFHLNSFFLPRVKLDPQVTRGEKALSVSPETR